MSERSGTNSFLSQMWFPEVKTSIGSFERSANKLGVSRTAGGVLDVDDREVDASRPIELLEQASAFRPASTTSPTKSSFMRDAGGAGALPAFINDILLRRCRANHFAI